MNKLVKIKPDLTGTVKRLKMEVYHLLRSNGVQVKAYVNWEPYFFEMVIFHDETPLCLIGFSENKKMGLSQYLEDNPGCMDYRWVTEGNYKEVVADITSLARAYIR